MVGKQSGKLEKRIEKIFQHNLTISIGMTYETYNSNLLFDKIMVFTGCGGDSKDGNHIVFLQGLLGTTKNRKRNCGCV